MDLPEFARYVTEHRLVGAPVGAGEADPSGGGAGPASTRRSRASSAGDSARVRGTGEARRTVGILPCPLAYQEVLVERARSAAAAEAGAPSALESAADEELEQAAALFYRFDLAGKGALSWEEFQRVLMHLEGRRGARPRGTVRKSGIVTSMRKLFTEADLDGDGELDFNEYLCIQRHTLMRVPEDSPLYRYPP